MKANQKELNRHGKFTSFLFLFLLWSIILPRSFCYSQEVFVGDLQVNLTYLGQPPSAANSGGSFQIILDNYNTPFSTFVDSQTLHNIPVGNYTLHLKGEFCNSDLTPPVPVIISTGQTTQVAFDLTNEVGILKGKVIANGQPAQGFTVYGCVNCGSMPWMCDGSASTQTGTDGSFRLMLPAGQGSGSISSPEGNSLATFTFTATAGTETDVGTINADTGDLQVNLTYLGQPPSAANSGGSFQIILDNYNTPFSTFVDSQTLHNIPVGNYTLHLKGEFCNSDLTPPVPVIISTGQTTQVAFDLTNEVGILKGKVIANGQPAQGFTVYGCVNCGSMPWMCDGSASTQTGTDGSFRLMLPAGQGSGSISSPEGNSLATFTFTATAGTETDVGTINADTGDLQVNLTYLGQPPSAANSGGSFQIILDNYNTPFSTFVDSQTLHNIPVGNYTLHLKGEFCNSDLTPPVPVIISTGQTTQVAFDLTNEVGILKGKVIANGQPAQGFTVYGCVNCGSMPWMCDGSASTQTGTDGSFRLMLPAGQGSGSISSPEGNSLATFTFTATAGTETDAITIIVGKGSLHGLLHENSLTGSALSGATVSCGGITGVTQSDGSYSLSNVPEGNQTLSFSKTGYQPYSKPVTITANQNLNVGDNYLAKNPIQTGNLHGRLHADSITGPGLSGATVSCGGIMGFTQPDGSYSLSNVPEGNQTLTFSKTSYQSYQKPVTITANQNLDAGDNYLLIIEKFSGTITSPQNNSKTGGPSLRLMADLKSNTGAGIKQLEFVVFYDNKWHSVGVLKTGPYQMDWNIPETLASQILKIGIHVEDNLNNRAEFLGGIPSVTYIESLKPNPKSKENWVPKRAYLNQRAITPQGDIKCSVASMAMVLAMNGIIGDDFISMSSKANEMYPKVLNADGSAVIGLMAKELNRLGLLATTKSYPVNTAWETIKSEIDSGKPVIVRTQHGAVTQYGHFFVSVGYRENSGFKEIITYDPFGKWLGNCCTKNYDLNATVPNSDKGKWVFYDFNKAFGLTNWLVTAKENSYFLGEIPTTPPDATSDEPENIGTYLGAESIGDINIFLPLIIH